MEQTKIMQELIKTIREMQTEIDSVRAELQQAKSDLIATEFSKNREINELIEENERLQRTIEGAAETQLFIEKVIERAV